MIKYVMDELAGTRRRRRFIDPKRRKEEATQKPHRLERLNKKGFLRLEPTYELLHAYYTHSVFYVFSQERV